MPARVRTPRKLARASPGSDARPRSTRRATSAKILLVPPTAHPLLDADDCARARAAVDALRRYWTPRHPELPSATLGAAAYLDIPTDGVRQYYTRATRARRALHREFDWLYERLTAAVEAALGAPAAITTAYAPPGFHIFRWHERLSELSPKLHYDLQHEHLDWKTSPNADPSRRFSFTVPIAMPAAGAGLYVWPITHGEPVPADPPGATYHPYALGDLFIHDGFHLHQIAADRPMFEGEERVTFQGHGVLDDGVWQLYW